MRRQAVLIFVLGVLCGALILAGGVFALQAFGNEAKAQTGATWKYQHWGDVRLNAGFTTPNPEVYIDDWVQRLPADCDLVFMGDARNVIFYRCPSS